MSAQGIVGVVGATGFIGSSCVRALDGNFEIRRIRAPRLRASSRSGMELRDSIEATELRRFAADALRGIDVLVNAAGLSNSTSTDFQSLLSANALLPLFLAEAAAHANVTRYVHISSAAVQGRGILDESESLNPDNRYALSKAIGEILLRETSDIRVVRYRPTSVHGPDRPLTRRLLRIAQSPLATVAAPGSDPSPQISAASVGNAVGVLSNPAVNPPNIVMHPWEGTTTESVLLDLGGKQPRRVNRTSARKLLDLAYSQFGQQGAHRAQIRRIELMLFGQTQTEGWLTDRLMPPSADWLKTCRLEILRRWYPNGKPRHEGAF